MGYLLHEKDQHEDANKGAPDFKLISAILRRKARELIEIAQTLEVANGLSMLPAGDSTPFAFDRLDIDRIDVEPGRAARAAAEDHGEIARRVYQSRRRRGRVFGDETLFGEPAWDILLDLFAAATHNKRVAVTSACIGAAVPSTTALRWIKVLEDKDLIQREDDTADARRTFVRLSPKGHALMTRYFAEGGC